VSNPTTVNFDCTFYINYQDPYSLYNVTLTYKTSFSGVKTTKKEDFTDPETEENTQKDVTRLTFKEVTKAIELIDTEIGGRITHE